MALELTSLFFSFVCLSCLNDCPPPPLTATERCPTALSPQHLSKQNMALMPLHSQCTRKRNVLKTGERRRKAQSQLHTTQRARWRRGSHSLTSPTSSWEITSAVQSLICIFGDPRRHLKSACVLTLQLLKPNKRSLPESG